jgi:hypothetical protein
MVGLLIFLNSGFSPANIFPLLFSKFNFSDLLIHKVCQEVKYQFKNVFLSSLTRLVAWWGFLISLNSGFSPTNLCPLLFDESNFSDLLTHKISIQINVFLSNLT